jgi:prepilin-type N-terminal cleavage/methylation domain-containing protein
VVRRQRGFTLLEIVFVLAIFGLFIVMLAVMTAEMRHQERLYPVQFMRHPQMIAVLSRMRKDVLDAFGSQPYPATYDTYTQTPSTLIVYSIQESGFAQTVVWDFREPGVVRRRAFSVGAPVSEWVARGVPQLSVGTYEIAGRPYGVRVRAFDSGGRLAIDQILQPRAH